MNRKPNSQELWSAASMVQRRHGAGAPLFVAERIGALALAGDQEGVNTWRAIARCLDQLRADGKISYQ
ncbi:hypothetical protein FHR23_002895 [Stakelama sediminis]|uniref:Uncharacterized protein n=1 Tax=Stakelama sediminis TaxID=463200 RepID=A0A840Z2K4_9SPHN|nr:hypothetical protein [Stakelama sediminis]MBB5719936.1 hypothetical protein [Stakelama sediminis]